MLGKIGRGSRPLLPFVGLIAILLIFVQTDVLTPFDRRVSALRMTYSQTPASGDVVVVAVDKRSLDAVGAWPWPRSIHGALIDRLRTSGARDIFLDFDFSYPTIPTEDDALRDALDRAGGGVLLPVFGQDDAMGQGSAGLVGINRPYAPFEKLSWPVAVTVPADPDGEIRRYFYSLNLPNGPIETVAAMLAGQQGPPDTTFAINFGVQARSLPIYSAFDVLQGQIDPVAFQDKSVIVGAFALELRDNFNVPVHGILPGAVIHALAAETLRSGTIPKMMKPAWGIGWSVLLVALMNIWHRRLRAWAVVVGLLGSCLLTEALAYVLYRADQLQSPTAIFHVGVLCYGFWRLSASLDVVNWRLRDQVARLDNATELLQRIFEHSAACIVVIDDRGMILTFSRSAERHFGAGPKAIALPQVFADIATAALAAGPGCTGSGPQQIALGDRVFEYTATLSKLRRAATGRLRRMTEEPLVTLSITDVTTEHLQQQRIAYLSSYDVQSGAFRRHAFENMLSDTLSVDTPATVLALQINGLAKVNAILGREVATAFLREIATQIRSVFGPQAAIGRLSDQVFAVLSVSPSTPEQNNALAQRLYSTLATPIQVKTAMIDARPQVGYASKPMAVGVDGAALLKQAEIALDAVVHTTGIDTMPFSPALADHKTRLLQIEDALWGAHARGEFVLLYQPQIDMETGQLVGVEALLRWMHPKLGSVPPDVFIPIAESNGYIHELGRWVLTKACHDARHLPDRIEVAVNVSGHQLHGDTFAAEVQQVLKATGLRPARLCLELTESVFVDTTDKIIRQMHAIASVGPTWALDDFGTGYSSFAYLSRFPLKKVKLDKSFIQAPDDDCHADAILRSVAVLCDGIDAVFLGEGVETQSQFNRLQDANCKLVQGYFFGKPQALDDILRGLSLPISA